MNLLRRAVGHHKVSMADSRWTTVKGIFLVATGITIPITGWGIIDLLDLHWGGPGLGRAAIPTVLILLSCALIWLLTYLLVRRDRSPEGMGMLLLVMMILVSVAYPW